MWWALTIYIAKIPVIFTESENARVRKNIIHHLFSIAALCAVVFTNTIWLTGCVIYDSKDLAAFVNKKLSHLANKKVSQL